jgi:menaquinone-dependent protoporphyrinogen oxidase
MDSNNTVLIVYATRNGQTEKIARRMAETLKAAGRPTMLVDAGRVKRAIPVDGVGAVLVGAPILAGGYSRHVVRFVREHRALLARVPSAFFSVGLAVASRTHDGRAQSLEVVEKFVKKTGWRPPRVELIAGALKYTEYGFITRFVIRRIARSEGGETDTSRDYEYTDWAAVDRFALEFAGRAGGEVLGRVPVEGEDLAGSHVAKDHGGVVGA